MKFTATKIKNTPYKYIDLKEYFKDILDYPEDEEDFLESYNFELLLEDKERILFAIRNNYRADLYSLDLEILLTNSLGSIGSKDISEGDSLYLRAIDVYKIAFEYRINDKENINGLYSTLEKELVFEFKTSNEYEYLYLSDEYYMLSRDSFVWDDSKDEWIYDFQKDHLYLYDRIKDVKYEIFDRRLKTSYHTSSNHFIHKWDGVNYLLNFPFNMDPEDSEAILKGDRRDEVLNAPKEISFIPLDLFIESVKSGESLPFKPLYSWSKTSVIKPYFYQSYLLKTLIFSVYDLDKKTIEVLEPILENGKARIKNITKGDYSHLETCTNVFYIGNRTILAHRDGYTEILSPISGLIKHRNREVLIDINPNGYLISGWDEDEAGDNYRDYMKILDSKGREIIKLDDYYIDLEYSNILIKI